MGDLEATVALVMQKTEKKLDTFDKLAKRGAEDADQGAQVGLLGRKIKFISPVAKLITQSIAGEGEKGKFFHSQKGEVGYMTEKGFGVRYDGENAFFYQEGKEVGSLPIGPVRPKGQTYGQNE